MRQIGKQILTIVALLLLVSTGRAQEIAIPIVSDPLTGVALDGYDPVSYFVDTEPRLGRPDFEYVWSGVSWYFTSAANRDVFARNPSVYAPQYGGHCAMSLSRGYLSDGKPRLYFIEALKLYFFYSTANRDAFLMSKAEAFAKAEENWANLSKGLPIAAAEEEVPEEAAEASEPEEPEAAPEPEEPAPVAHDGADDNVPAH